jgi:2,4-dienoyl-CoA reductase-like NADH-dependent reductase (Old Yellow Enzyme family)
MATEDGQPLPALGERYATLAQGGVGTLITGFAFTAREGRAMQPGQCGIETDARIGQWQHVLQKARQHNTPTRFFLQIAHAGRQTRRLVTGQPALGATSRRCTYFREPVRPMSDADIHTAVDGFARAAWRAREAGFDGVQVHAAHGYLIHQFLSPWTNRRRDAWRDPPRFLEAVVRAIQNRCGDAFPVLVKLSAADDNTPGLRLDDTILTAKRLAALGVDALEITYGTMEYALNIIRGACPVPLALQVNPLFRDRAPLLRWFWLRFFLKSYTARFMPFAENYNLAAAATIRREAAIPVITVGGVSSGTGIAQCLAAGVDAVSLCRALVCEPDFPRRLLARPDALSGCTHCNLCTIYCDSSRPLQCYRQKEASHELNRRNP